MLMELGTICNVPLYNIYRKLDFNDRGNIRYYKNHDICIEEVNAANYFSKETII